MKARNLFIITCIILFSLSGLALRNFPFSQGNLDKAMPPVITSYDVFANTEQTKWIYDSEQAYYYSPARTGGIEKVIGTHPTLYYLFIATFTKLTTLPVYQTAYLAVNLLSIIIILQIFMIVKKIFGDETALIALALGAIPAHKWLFPMYVGFQYDYFTFITLPIILFLIMLRIETKLSKYQKAILYGTIGFLLVEQFLGHYVELLLYAPFFVSMPLIFVWKKIISIKEYVIAIILVSLILTPYLLHFLPLTMKDHLRGGVEGVMSQFSPELSKHMDYFPWPRLDFWLNMLSILGIITLTINYKKNAQSSKTIYLLFILYLLFVGFSNYTLNTWANRAERQLFQGYPFLVLLAAIGITIILNTIQKITKIPNIKKIALIGVLLFIPYNQFTPTYDVLSSIDQAAFVDEPKWQSIEWLRDRTPKASVIFALSGFEHEFSMFTERTSLKGDLNRGYTVDNIKALCTMTYPDKYKGEWAFREYGIYGLDTYVKKRTGINTFEDVQEPFQDASKGYVFKGPDRGNQSVPLKFFDYILLQYKGTTFDPCMAYFLNESINRGHKIAWYNQEMAVVQINKTAKENSEKVKNNDNKK